MGNNATIPPRGAGGNYQYDVHARLLEAILEELRAQGDEHRADAHDLYLLGARLEQLFATYMNARLPHGRPTDRWPRR